MSKTERTTEIRERYIEPDGFVFRAVPADVRGDIAHLLGEIETLRDRLSGADAIHGLLSEELARARAGLRDPYCATCGLSLRCVECEKAFGEVEG